MEKKNGNWTIKDTDVIFENDFFTVYEDKVIQPDGSNGTYATIKLPPGVCVLPIDDEDFVYMTKQFRYSAGRETLEVVAGSVEDESPLDAAKRELKEELGITAEEVKELGKLELDNSIIKNEISFFTARKLSFEEPERESSEEMETVKIKFSEAIEKIFKDEIVHAPSCALLLKTLASKAR
ncbi:MAG: nudF 3 [Acidobacteria bacterium]|jgi:8-oxo-dGTP pyrophosphatase MutT (NUDIX family)|nr:nudF 3 [Acidobacteriota bacterium]